VTAPVSVVDLGGGGRIAYRVYGDPAGYPVLALHGTPATSLMFAVADAPARAAGLKLIAPDRPGYGATPLDAAPTLSSRTQALARFADALGLARCGVVGISGGGPYATALAAHLGARVERLALVGPVGPFAEPELARRLSPRARAFFLDVPSRHPRLVQAGASLGAALFRVAPHATGRMVAALAGGADRAVLSDPGVEAAMLRMTRDALADGIEGALADVAIFSSPWAVVFAAIRAPTVLWHGTEDRIVPFASGQRLAQLIPGCRFERLAGAGHFWVFEHVAEVLAELRPPQS
jgi:pimeloyl-ACP methyl ester carboxylesterase